MDIEHNLALYLDDRQPTARYSSFDYCFNYFQSQRERQRLAEILTGADLQLACLHLGFFLASWGMLRGSTALHTKSLKHYVPVIETVVRAPSQIWSIDVDGYTDEAIEMILEFRRHLRSAFPQRASDILVTKIMLGVFGCVPAFDGQFQRGFRVSGLGANELRRVAAFYSDNSEVIDRYRVPTIDFDTGRPTNRRYTRAKVIDMIFFIEGAPT